MWASNVTKRSNLSQGLLSRLCYTSHVKLVGKILSSGIGRYAAKIHDGVRDIDYQRTEIKVTGEIGEIEVGFVDLSMFSLLCSESSH